MSDRYRLLGQGYFSSAEEALADMEPEPRREDLDEEAEGLKFARTLRESAAARRASVDLSDPAWKQWQTLVEAEALEDRAEQLEKGE